MLNCFLRCESDDDTAFLCSYAHVKILIEERLNQFVIFSGNVQRNAFILIYALAVQVPLPRDSALDPNQLTGRLILRMLYLASTLASLQLDCCSRMAFCIRSLIASLTPPG